MKHLEKSQPITDFTNVTTREHRLVLRPDSLTQLTQKIADSKILVKYTKTLVETDPVLQFIIQKGLIEAYRIEVRKYLPCRVAQFANQFGFKYKNVYIKNVKSRWESCSAKNNTNFCSGAPARHVCKLREQILKSLPKDYYLISNEYQSEEHSLEALIPFLQYYNRDVEIVPILVPYMNWERMDSLSIKMAEVLGKIIKVNDWELGKDIGFLISTDCCHYGDQDWGGKNYAPFGCDLLGYKKTIDREYDLIYNHLSGSIEPNRLHRLLYRLVDKSDIHQYKITWCGRFSVPFCVDFLHRLTQCLRIQLLDGHLLRYGTSVSLGELPIRNLGLGSTAPSNLHHCVGYCAMGFR